uniref:Uncharacterized protein n=1 Tax=Lactuca sativa TaxID=4236 RepID=A0A9R1VF83_LACSA|nr:hypothetical protein LSAT_V11C500248360 [Lactuca sativa]
MRSLLNFFLGNRGLCGKHINQLCKDDDGVSTGSQPTGASIVMFHGDLLELEILGSIKHRYLSICRVVEQHIRQFIEKGLNIVGWE